MNEAEVLSDFRRRYEGTFIFVQEPSSKEKGLYYMAAVESSPNKVATLKLQSDEVGMIRLNFGSQHELHFCVPPVGVFQFGIDAMACLRNPRKQYRRGLCSDNTNIHPVTGYITSSGASRFTWALVNAAFEHKTFSFKEGLSMLETNKYRSVALANNMSLSLSMTDSPDHILFQWAMPIARISKEGKLVHVYEKVMEPQINRYLQEEAHGSN